jgi:hypothetical protein
LEHYPGDASIVPISSPSKATDPAFDETLPQSDHPLEKGRLAPQKVSPSGNTTQHNFLAKEEE